MINDLMSFEWIVQITFFAIQVAGVAIKLDPANQGIHTIYVAYIST